MEEILKECARQVPALVILVILATLFTRSGASVVAAFLSQMSEARAEYLKAIDRFHNENMEARAASRVALTENTVAADKQTAAVAELASEVRELRTTLQPVIHAMHKARSEEKHR